MFHPRKTIPPLITHKKHGYRKISNCRGGFLLSIQTYVPLPPMSGRTIIHIVRVAENNNSILIYYDIAVGSSAGFAYCYYQATGRWPLVWTITKKPAGEVVRRCALDAIQHTHQHIKTLSDAAGTSLMVHLDCTDDDIHICRSYPLDTYKINPDDIRLSGTVSWASGSPELLRANLLATYNPTLPIMLIDKREKDSPMVTWAAEHRLLLLPTTLAAGDYQMLNGKYIVDRKSDLLELYNDFCMPDNRRRYETAAITAAAHGKDLVYIISTDEAKDFNDLQNWTAKIPGKSKNANGVTLVGHVRRYADTFPNVSFIFCSPDHLCKTIFDQINKKI